MLGVQQVPQVSQAGAGALQGQAGNIADRQTADVWALLLSSAEQQLYIWAPANDTLLSAGQISQIWQGLVPCSHAAAL